MNAVLEKGAGKPGVSFTGADFAAAEFRPGSRPSPDKLIFESHEPRPGYDPELRDSIIAAAKKASKK